MIKRGQPLSQFMDEINSDEYIYNLDLKSKGYGSYLNSSSVNEFLEALASVRIKEY